MKAALTFDPADHDYGPTTTAIRAIVDEWVSIDWFEPCGTSDEELMQRFHDHNRRAHRIAPTHFAKQTNARVVSGGMTDFQAWCDRVRGQTSWNWRFSGLKDLAHEHLQHHGWSLEAHAPSVPEGTPAPGDLFVRVNYADGQPGLFWNSFLPELPFDTLGPHAEGAAFYVSHARTDLYHAIEWQLAEGRTNLRLNAFFPLLQCYRAGGCPFSLDRDNVVIFRFS